MQNTYTNLIFDLDGTISDPSDGIARSLNYALVKHGFEAQPESKLTTFIGPPLDYIFSELTGVTDEPTITSLVAGYRERYSDVGYAENTLYNGMKAELQLLRQQPGVRMGVCSSKRLDFVEKIVEMFGLQDCFEFLSGGEIGIEKGHQIAQLLSDGRVDQHSVMIGDRKFDLVAAHSNGLDAVGVLWGFGSKIELAAESPAFLFDRVDQFRSLVQPAASGFAP